MMTFNGNSISKKYIQSILRTMDKTAICCDLLKN